MIYAPIVIPTLNRDKHFRRLIDSLQANGWAKYTDVYIALDYPPDSRYSVGYERICKFLDEYDGSPFKSFNVVKRTYNYGVGKNGRDLIETVIIPRYDRWIFSEDDLEFSPNFIEYMDKSLERYADDESVQAICGYSYPLRWNVSGDSTAFFTQATYSAWGTGQWRNKNEKARDAILRQHYLLENRDRAYANGLVDAMIPGRRAEYVSDIAAKVFELKNGNADAVAPVSTADYYASAKGPVSRRPTNSLLSSLKLRNAGFDASDWISTLGRYMSAPGDQ